LAALTGMMSGEVQVFFEALLGFRGLLALGRRIATSPHDAAINYESTDQIRVPFVREFEKVAAASLRRARTKNSGPSGFDVVAPPLVRLTVACGLDVCAAPSPAPIARVEQDTFLGEHGG
jgi:hypothetical protein